MANANRGECAERNVALIWFLFGSLTRITETCCLKVKDVFYKDSGKLKSIFRMDKDYAKGGRSRDCALVLKQQRKALIVWRDKRIHDKAFLSDDGSYGGLKGDSPLFLSFKGSKRIIYESSKTNLLLINYSLILNSRTFLIEGILGYTMKRNAFNTFFSFIL